MKFENNDNISIKFYGYTFLFFCHSDKGKQLLQVPVSLDNIALPKWALLLKNLLPH